MKLFTLSLSILLTHATIHAQQVTNAGGGTGIIDRYTIDWNFGELTLIDAPKINSLLITQGLIQPEKGIFTQQGSGITASEIIILPNPTSGILKAWAGFLTPGKLQFELFDAKGSRLLSEEKTYTGFTAYEFNLERFAAASYPLKITWTPSVGPKRNTTFIIVKQ